MCKEQSLVAFYAMSWFALIWISSLAPSMISLNGLFAKVFGVGAWVSQPNGFVIKSVVNGTGALCAVRGTSESDENLTSLVALFKKSGWLYALGSSAMRFLVLEMGCEAGCSVLN